MTTQKEDVAPVIVSSAETPSKPEQMCYKWKCGCMICSKPYFLSLVRRLTGDLRDDYFELVWRCSPVVDNITLCREHSAPLIKLEEGGRVE